MKAILKRGIAVCMMSVMSFMLPATPVYQSVESVSRAATVKSDATYISETKLFIKKGGSAGDAKAWCESQGDGWHYTILRMKKQELPYLHRMREAAWS